MRRGLFIVLALGCASAPEARAPMEPALLFEGMGDHKRRVSTDNERAQRYFDQGLALVYGFNHDEAAESFSYAAHLDPDCAAAHWGEAYALGPNYNKDHPSAEQNERSLAALERARRARNASPVERDLIAALALRFTDPQPKDRTALNEAYAGAMGELWKKYPEDDDIGTLYADALMNLNAWKLWSKDGKPRRHTEEIIATLKRVLKMNVNHPLANHLYIHALEPSPNPKRAEEAADRLAGLVPGIGHLVHMPGHIYMRIGRYMDSVETNRKATALDRAYFARKKGTQGVYHWYHAHNEHFLAWSAMYAGRYEDAVLACERIVAALPEEFLSKPPAAEYVTSIYHVYVRFGKWGQLLAAPPPPSTRHYALAMHHYGRGIAYANTARFGEARSEAAAFERHAAAVPRDMATRRVPAHDVLEVARQMLAGETAFLSGDERQDKEKGLEHLRRAVSAEDGFRYQEPSSWMMPARHALGALLLDAGEVEEAEAVYREDLELHAENGWALNGLAECLERQGRTGEAADVRRRFDDAWSHATVKTNASCYCRRGADGVAAK